MTRKEHIEMEYAKRWQNNDHDNPPDGITEDNEDLGHFIKCPLDELDERYHCLGHFRKWSRRR